AQAKCRAAFSEALAPNVDGVDRDEAVGGEIDDAHDGGAITRRAAAAGRAAGRPASRIAPVGHPAAPARRRNRYYPANAVDLGPRPFSAPVEAQAGCTIRPMSDPCFVHLRVHSEFSIADGIVRL